MSTLWLDITSLIGKYGWTDMRLDRDIQEQTAALIDESARLTGELRRHKVRTGA